VGKAASGRDTRRELASCAGGRENSVAQQTVRRIHTVPRSVDVSVMVWSVAAEIAVGTWVPDASVSLGDVV
jgi:hypothetical protein